MLFRRRWNLQVDELATKPARQPNPNVNAAVPHIRILGSSEPAPSQAVAEAALGGPERPPEDLRPPPFHIRAVPIDGSPVGEQRAVPRSTLRAAQRRELPERPNFRAFGSTSKPKAAAASSMSDSGGFQ